MKKSVGAVLLILQFMTTNAIYGGQWRFGTDGQILVSISPGFKVETSKKNHVDHIEIVHKKIGQQSRDVEVVFTTPTARALILPMNEGHYVPIEDKDWSAHLCKRWPYSMTEAFSFPAWGYDFEGKTATIITTNQFDNEVSYLLEEKKISIKVKHTFTTLSPNRSIGFLVSFGGPSLLTPALTYRRHFLKDHPEARLATKIIENPRVKRLLGAPHAYVWGDWILAQENIKDWRAFCKLLFNSRYPLWLSLSKKGKDEIRDVAQGGYVFPYRKLVIIEELDKVLKSPAFLDKWKPDESLAKLLTRREDWGAGVSKRLLRRLTEDGFKKFALFLGDIDSGVDHPQVAQLANELGYLYGPYDAYHSVHHPKAKETWPTAQFDLVAYEKGAMKRANRSYYGGFNGIGRKINPKFALPYMKKRVAKLLENLHYTNWFIDCDAYGELHNDYSADHPLTQEEDAFLRTSRMKWLSDELGLVVGSEGGASYAIPGIHAAHGMMTPVFGFRDPDMKTKGKPHYLGAYWPEDGPHVMIDQVPLKPYYYKFHYDPRYRLPLYQAAFHDCVIATHHWGYSTLKFKETVVLNELLELLYSVPPLYHLNQQTYTQHGERMRNHCSVFCPLHERLALKAMTAFSWLSKDRMVQQTIFDDGTRLIANFSDKAHHNDKVTIGALSVKVFSKDGDLLVEHSPKPN